MRIFNISSYKILIMNLLFLCATKANSFDFEKMLMDAAKEDPQIANAFNSREVASQRLENASRLINPISYLGFNSMKNSATLNGVPDAGDTRQNFLSSSANATLIQPIYNPIRKININQASLQLKLEELQIQLTRNELALRLLQTLLDLTGAMHNVQSLENEINVLSSFLEAHIGKNDGGDLASYQIRLKQAEGQADLSRNIIMQKKRDLARLVGASVIKDDISLKKNLPVFNTKELPSLDEFLYRSENESLQIRLQSMMVEMSSALTTRSARETYPTIDFIANRIVTRGMPVFPNAQTTATSVGVQLNLPLSYGGNTSLLQSEAISLESRAKNDLEAQRKFIHQSISDSYHELQNIRTQLNTEIQLLAINTKKEKITTTNSMSRNEFSSASIEIESRLSKIQSNREFNRLNRDSIMHLTRLWATSGSLEGKHFRLISSYFD